MKYEIKIKESDLNELKKKIRDLKAIDERGLSGALKKAAKTAVNNAKRNAPVDTGHLVGNIKYDPFIQEKRVEIRSDADYSGYVEFGTRSQSAQPYFVPAIRLAVRNLKKDLDRLIKKAIS